MVNGPIAGDPIDLKEGSDTLSISQQKGIQMFYLCGRKIPTRTCSQITP